MPALFMRRIYVFIRVIYWLLFRNGRPYGAFVGDRR